MKPSTFRNQAVVITGASRGIGREMALQLADTGAQLVLAARSAEDLATVAADCRRRGAAALAVPTDVADPDACRALIDRAVDEFGRLDMLVNNAGMSMLADFADLPDLSNFERIGQVNFWGNVHCTHHALAHLLKSGGRIVVVSSVKGRFGTAGSTAYCASKHALTGFYDALRSELHDTGVSVTVVYPGFVATAMAEHVLDASGRPLGPDARKLLPKRAMSAETCARVILRAAARRRREKVLTCRGKLAVCLRLLAPGLLDRLARRALPSRRC
jgi:NAD(P)-dependent dehydrogenase (short-subunit alcohol dehydrogenase family)